MTRKFVKIKVVRQSKEFKTKKNPAIKDMGDM
jgi:hypothetical protein